MICTYYKQISDYATIGNLRSVALIGNDGSIDWCCFPVVDSGSVFGSLLDVRKGGRFQVSVPDAGVGVQYYAKDSNVLKTEFKIGKSKLTITDFMPLWGDISKCGGSYAPPEIHRIVECQGDDMEIEVEWSPRLDYARTNTQIKEVDKGWVATAENNSLSLGKLENARLIDQGYGPILHSLFQIKEGEQKVMVTRWNNPPYDNKLNDSLELMKRTINVWKNWSLKESVVDEHEWTEEWLPFLIRSRLALKLMIHDDTGSMLAAPTTSLPETIGGVRNWDYRFAWIRDASLIAQALISAGHQKEAVDLLHWMERVSADHFQKGHGLQIMYGLHGESDLEEIELEHLEGYKRSRPVRIGNEAAKQLQLETYGELLNTAYELVRRHVQLEPKIKDFLKKVVDHACNIWKEPDYGIWEVRCEPQHFTYSKVMIWVALDRAIHLATDYGFPGEVEKWRKTRSEIKKEVLQKGYDEELGSFVQVFGSKDLDAANLRIPLLEFLPFDDDRVQGTIDMTLKKLSRHGLVYRYFFDDGLPGEEGAFGICTFWLVDALALSGRTKEARDIFENMINHTNHVGLLSEQLDPITGEFLGNFPQAYSHIGMINSMIYLAYAEGRPLPEKYPIGTPEHRAEIKRS